MARVRILGPRERLADTLRVLQHLETVHLAAPPQAAGMAPVDLTPAQQARRELLDQLVDDLTAAHRLVRAHVPHGPRPVVPPELDLEDACTRARAWREDLESLDQRATALREERAMLDRFLEMVRGFEPLGALVGPESGVKAFYLVLSGRPEPTLRVLRRSVEGAVGAQAEIATHPLSGGGTGVAILVPEVVAPAIEELLQQASLDEMAAPDAYGGGSLFEALPTMQARFATLPPELAAVEAELAALAHTHAGEIEGLLGWAHDQRATLDATLRAAETDRAFVLDGWVPDRARPALHAALEPLGPTVVVQVVPLERSLGDPPVRLRNPGLFRPFETIVRMMPLPAYGTIDPTPFVAVGFPMLFGLILGDAGYGVALAALAGVLYARSSPGSTLRSISQIGIACAAFTVIFGLLYGEILGDLGHHLLGLEPILMNREEAIIPSLVLAVGIGAVHILLGMVLGVIAARREPRKAIGRGIGAIMLVLVIVLLLTVFGQLPAAVFHPVLVAALVAFPLLVVLEGVLAPIEFLSTLANVLSYARIMAVGTASVMLAVVANRLVGAMGSVLVGVLFGLVFHLVNFAIGVFGPTVHVLRLHYVEFFSKFVTPGGSAYEPLRHWHPEPQE